MENEVIDGDNAVDFICESIKKYNKDLIILAIGPLTNIAKDYSLQQLHYIHSYM